GPPAAQIAKGRAARVIGAVRKDTDFSAARDNGADEVVDTSSTNVADAVRAFTAGRGAAVIFDTSGMMFADAVEAAAHGGRVPVIAAPANGTAAFNLRNLYRKELRVIGIATRRMDAVAGARLLAAMTPYFDFGHLRFQSGPA